jgi:hypothetical protein
MQHQTISSKATLQAEPSKEEDCGCEEKVNLKAMPQVSFSSEKTAFSDSVYRYITYLSYFLLACYVLYFITRYTEMRKDMRVGD